MGTKTGMRSTSLVALALVGAVVLAMLVAACGQDEQPEAPADPTAAPAATQPQPGPAGTPATLPQGCTR